MAAEDLELAVIDSFRLHVRGTFGLHNLSLISSQSALSMTPFHLFHCPCVVITYRLAIMDDRNDEMWCCEMIPTAQGFSINNGEYFIEVHVSPCGLIFTQDHNFHTSTGRTGLVTLLLPSTRPQMFESTLKLFSTDGSHIRCVSSIHKGIPVPGPKLDEYQEGPGIEKPIRKIRPHGMWSSAVGMRIVNCLQRLADDGKRYHFMNYLRRLQELADVNTKFIDLIPLALYELAMLDLHENRTEEAEQHARRAMEICKRFHSTNDRFLLSKVKYVQSALARRKGDYCKAKELLDDSVELLLPCAAGEETAENRYFLASYYVEKAARVGITDHEQSIAEIYFQDVEQHLNAETRPITNRFHIRSKNRQVAFYIKSSRHARNLNVGIVVPEEHMAKALQLIEEIERALLIFYPKKPLLTFDIVKTDYHIRRGNYEEGIAPSEEALRIARENHWYEYEEVAFERQQLCRRNARGRHSRRTSSGGGDPTEGQSEQFGKRVL